MVKKKIITFKFDQTFLLEHDITFIKYMIFLNLKNPYNIYEYYQVFVNKYEIKWISFA